MTGAARRKQRTLVLLAAVVLVGAVGVAVVRAKDDGPPTLDDFCGPPEVVSDLPAMQDDDPVTVGVEPLGAVEQAVAMAEAPDGQLFVVSRDGQLWAIRPGSAPTQVLDLRDEIVTTSIEQGLLGVAVRPDGSALYIDGTFTDGTATILEYLLVDGSIDPASRRVVFSEHDPAPSHNGGRLQFGADGYLYFGIGDGGEGALTGAAQDLGSPFGKILRLDPTPAAGRGYSIPPDNPFVDVPGARPEVWAYGFRNPWGWSLDADTGDLWVGDVGQLCFEEVDHVPDGGEGVNFGWSYTEGAHAFEGPILGAGGEPDLSIDPPDLGERPKGLVAPVLEYVHDDQHCSVIGGAVYHAPEIRDLDGRYLWADLCDRTIHTLRPDGDGWRAGVLSGELPGGVVSFGQAADGGIYLVSLSDGIFRLTAPSGER